MKTTIPLEELLLDAPQNRTLIRLFEEDTYNLRAWSHQFDTALDQWSLAQNAMIKAADNLASVIASYRFQKLPLDVAAYDIPSITGRVAQNLTEIVSWMELLLQQIGFCVQSPIKKVLVELDDLVETVRPNYADALGTVAEAEERFAKASRKDTARRLEELNNDVFITKMNYHKLALQYCSRMNMLQSRRYSELIEPMLMLLYAFKGFFNAGHDAFRKDALTGFLTQAQQQMLAIGKEAEKDKEGCEKLLASILEQSKTQHDLYYGENPHLQQPSLSESVQKQGYLRIRLKTGIFTNNWEKYYVFTQGAKLMWQKADQLVGSLMLDLTKTPGTSAQIAGDNVDRRFVFIISLPAAEDEPAGIERKWLLQARNNTDMYEWIEVINNLSGIQQKIPFPNEEPTNETVKKDAEKTLPLARPHTPTEASSIRHAITPLSTPAREIAYDMAFQPIQFDLLPVGANSQLKLESNMADSDMKQFDVHFLGCMEVLSGQGGDIIVQATIEHVLKARQRHTIVDSIACRMLISAQSNGIFLVDHDQANNVKAHYDFADIAFWSPGSSHDQEDGSALFGMITRSRDDKNSYPTYMCSVLRTDGNTTSLDICNELTNASAKSLNELLVKASTKDQDTAAAAAAAAAAEESPTKVVEKPTEAIKKAAEKPTEAVKKAGEKPTEATKKAAEKPTEATKKVAEKPTAAVENDEKKVLEKPTEPKADDDKK